jgi:hypothetical protein
MNLSTSDVVALVVGIGQILVTVAVGVLAATQASRLARARDAAANPTPSRGRRSNFGSFVFLCIAAYGAYRLLNAGVYSRPYSNSEIIMIIYWCFYIAFNLLCIPCFWLADRIFYILSSVVDVQHKEISLHQGHVETQRHVSGIVGDLVSFLKADRLSGRTKRRSRK